MVFSKASAKKSPSGLPLLWWWLLLLSASPYNNRVVSAQNNNNQPQEFNTQVMARVLERLEDFMKIPVQATARAEKLRTLGFFPHQLQGQDRDRMFQYLYGEDPVVLYYGLEDGTFLLHSGDFTEASYREPGASGYSTSTNSSTARDNFYHTCVNRTTGEPQNCTMEEGADYIQCREGDCSKLWPCWWDETLVVCGNSTACLELALETAELWCPSYSIEQATAESEQGFIPRTYHCIGKDAITEEDPGQVLQDSNTKELGNCYFGDGTTLVNRSHLSGQYQFCVTNSNASISNGNDTEAETCTGLLTGGFRSRDYDPRYRGWYTLSKEQTQNAWSDPYPFFSDLQMGVTYTQPMFNEYVYNSQPRKEFYGVWAVDYSLTKITRFLTSQYNNTEMWVLVVEVEPPHNVIAASTGSPAATKVLASNSTLPCPENDSTVECDVIRVPVASLGDNGEYPENIYGDNIVKRAFAAYAEAGYPDLWELIGFKGEDEIGSEAYVVQGQIYEQEGASNLQWYTLVVMPMARSLDDAVLPGDSSFVIVCIIASIGVVGCFALFMIIFRKRHEEAFINGDWRFTSAFILGCSCVNISTYTLLGDNTDGLCQLRMWSFNYLFAAGKTLICHDVILMPGIRV